MSGGADSHEELMVREGDGVRVSLIWERASSQVLVAVHDSGTDASFQFEVDGDKALDAFHHPYAYAASLLLDETCEQTAADSLAASQRAA